MKSFLVALFFAFPTAAAADVYWVKAGHGESCKHVCDRGTSRLGSMKAVNGGRWSGNGNYYYVCATFNAEDRPGYQIQGFGSNKCFTDHGGGHRGFHCLCTDSGQSDIPFVGGD